ncbi:PREDICTED: formin-like protein 14 [Trachymyrmex septentrionalis]|uniref:formin-like protein 14 n=1 Tax=Trachymyrmex septentrionalis TaxID=34720 RepID=UPI00084F7140|nr:PREDICTED: formin-like protein 14 [Trachymyrmex septentrionalis]
MLANAAEFRLASMGCWSAAVTTEVLLPATRLAWYTVAVGASSEPPVASSWAPIGADGPWSPSDEATLTASSFSGGRKTALPRLPPPPPPPPPPLPVALGEHVLGGGSVVTGGRVHQGPYLLPYRNYPLPRSASSRWAPPPPSPPSPPPPPPPSARTHRAEALFAQAGP